MRERGRGPGSLGTLSIRIGVGPNIRAQGTVEAQREGRRGAERREGEAGRGSTGQGQRGWQSMAAGGGWPGQAGVAGSVGVTLHPSTDGNVLEGSDDGGADEACVHLSTL